MWLVLPRTLGKNTVENDQNMREGQDKAEVSGVCFLCLIAELVVLHSGGGPG